MTVDLAYAAGFFDGEGCAGIYDRKHASGNYGKVTQITVVNTDLDVLVWLNNLFGVGSIQRRKVRSPKHNTAFAWQVNALGALKVARLLLPYSKVKRSDPQQIVDFYETA